MVGLSFQASDEWTTSRIAGRLPAARNSAAATSHPGKYYVTVTYFCPCHVTQPKLCLGINSTRALRIWISVPWHRAGPSTSIKPGRGVRSNPVEVLIYSPRYPKSAVYSGKPKSAHASPRLRLQFMKLLILVWTTGSIIGTCIRHNTLGGDSRRS